MEWLAKHAPDNTYVMFQDTLHRLGDWRILPVSHYFFLYSMLYEKPQVGGCYGTRYVTQPLANTEWTHLFGQPIPWLTAHPDELYRILRELGISYVAAYSPPLVAAMRSRSDLFEGVYSAPPIHVFRTREVNPIVSIASGKVLGVRIRPNLIEVEYEASEETYIYVRQVNHPGWRAYVGSKEVEVEDYYPDIPRYVVVFEGVLTNYKVPFIKVKVPAGRGKLTLEFRRVTYGRLASSAALAALALATAAPLAPKRLKRAFRRLGAGQ